MKPSKKKIKNKLTEIFTELSAEIFVAILAFGVGFLIVKLCGFDGEIFEHDVEGIALVGVVAIVLLIVVGYAVTRLVKKIKTTKNAGHKLKDLFAVNKDNMREIGWLQKLINRIQQILRLGAGMVFVASLITYVFWVVGFNSFSVSPRPVDGTTLKQPFAKGTGGSDNFRIPGIVTLDDGTIVAVTDARWNHTMDNAGLDTIVSVSHDDGATWHYTFANYFGDNGNEKNDASTCFIDPALATDGETIYMIVDVNPSGFAVSSSPYTPLRGKEGFDDQNRLLLRTKDSVKVPFGGLTYGLACHLAEYDYYLDYTDNTESAYGIYCRETSMRVEGYEVDLFFNVTYIDKDGKAQESNLFYHTSPFQVYPTSYLYLTSSTDGINWFAPTLLNLKTTEEEALLVGPGNGIYDEENDRFVFTCYYHNWYEPEYASLIWMDGDGNWHRSENATVDTWSSEATTVLLDDGRVRMFYRDGGEELRYTDYVFDEVRGNYFRDDNATEVSTGAVKVNGCQLSAIRYSKDYEGKPLILVSTPTGKERSRVDGVIHAFVVESDSTMTLINTYEVVKGFYAYSCLTELEDGNVGLIYESDAGALTYVKLSYTDLIGK